MNYLTKDAPRFTRKPRTGFSAERFRALADSQRRQSLLIRERLGFDADSGERTPRSAAGEGEVDVEERSDVMGRLGDP